MALRPTPLRLRITAARRAGREAGYSLVEVLAAVAITAIMATLVVLNFPTIGPGTSADRSAAILGARVQLASQHAIVSGAVVGLHVDEQGYRFHQFHGGAWGAVRGAEALAPAQWPPDAVVTLEIEGAPDLSDLDEDEIAALPPLVRLDPTGMATPFSIQVAHLDSVERLSVDRSARVVWERTDDR